jgi:hypothetical protein
MAVKPENDPLADGLVPGNAEYLQIMAISSRCQSESWRTGVQYVPRGFA